MSCMTLPVTKGRPTLTQDSDGKTEIITDITCKFKGKLIAMEVKVDPGSKTKLYPIESFQVPVSSAMQKGWHTEGECPGTNSGSV